MDPDSPITRLLRSWWGAAPPRHTHIALRANLYQAAADEIMYSAAQGLIYNPAKDARFQWASAWLDVAAGDISVAEVNRGTESAAAFLLGVVQCPVNTRQHAAANDR